MDYNTEVISSAAKQLADMLNEMVIRQQEQGQGTLSIAQIEGHVREVVRQIGMQALSHFLSGMQTTPALEIPCRCGGRL